ncbi:DUF433 domain-containing protein [Nostoc sp. MG11]|uniref:DUF433 domain-containing protein n=1 Tax=Nostoc sp. MG11 TaxID=2721166 RepID=UPI0039B6FB99
MRAIVETWRMGVSPEEIPQGLPHLTLAQVFDALSYYTDHQDEINAYIERNRIPDELIVMRRFHVKPAPRYFPFRYLQTE